jgi:predicted permease
MIHDIRYAARLLLRSPGVTAPAILALALGAGANSAIFSIVYTALLRPLPVRDADRLVTVAMANEKLRVTAAQPGFSVYAAYKQHGRFYESIAAASTGTAAFDTGDTTVKLWRVTAGFLPALGIAPRLGRNFLSEEDRPGSARVALVAYDFWRTRLNGSPMGATIKLDGEPHVLIGVLPPGFHVDGRPADVYSPLARSLDSREYLPVNIYARLKPGVSIEQAQAEIDATARHAPAGPFVWRARLWRLREFQVRNIRLSLWVLLGASGLVLLIACANTASLLLTRAGARQREIATRSALGAGRSRLLRQLLTESVLLSLAGAVCGVVVALGAVRLVPLLAHERLPGILEQSRVDAVVLAFTIAVSLATALVFGLAPAVATLRGEAFGSLRSGARADSRSRSRAWDLLIVSETALALVLAIGAALLIRTFFYLRDVAPGFHAEGLLTVRITPPKGKFTSQAQCNAYWQDIIDGLRGIPGVQGASFAQALPLTGDNWIGTWTVEGVQFARPQDIPPMWQYYVQTDYFRTMHIPLRAGRFFSERDHAAAQKVVIVSESFVRRFWPGRNAIGKHVGGGKDPAIEVIGVVGDVSADEATKSPPPELYLHFLQFPTARITAVIRPDPAVFANPLALEAAVRSAIAAVDPTKPPLQFAEMRRLISDRIAPNRLSAQLIAAFAGLALVLATLGIYAVLSFTVAQRTHEIGVRIALGAERASVVISVVRRAALLALCGIGIGLAGALALTRVLKSLLFGVAATDPSTYAAGAIALLVVALAAATAPALRAAQVDPVASLRHE